VASPSRFGFSRRAWKGDRITRRFNSASITRFAPPEPVSRSSSQRCALILPFRVSFDTPPQVGRVHVSTQGSHWAARRRIAGSSDILTYTDPKTPRLEPEKNDLHYSAETSLYRGQLKGEFGSF